ncbi:hypothetical protein BGZ63DRAFT_368192 [Mariannaea sp. PMI_226]|nr:hypothetical protein BGZ63DRAFT_368192 [Mariannaea sp. PMI_226]
MPHSNAPIASYFLPGFYDNPLPIGKYYPSNYEQRNRSQKTLEQPRSGSLSSNITCGSQMCLQTTDEPSLQISESESRHKLQQYKRDMIFLVRQAASDLLYSSAIANQNLGDDVSLSSIPIRDIRLTGPVIHKPNSPRLLPVDSPDPVTPMDLDCINGGGSVDKER